ncbi:MAG: host attachment family protein [Pseudomonadota bacterium]|nr:host attachment family protein [Pseudomonadota bacterium]MDQ3160940.1 host attachment family protein [Pseudomonadota bacterium]
MSNIPADAMVVVADGERARMFRNVGTEQAISLKQQEILTPKDLENDGPSGVAPPEQTEHQTDEATFAKQLAHRLNHGALTNAYAHLVLVADPSSLGLMRPQLHKETLARMHCEVAKTLTNSSVEDIERALS